MSAPDLAALRAAAEAATPGTWQSRVDRVQYRECDDADYPASVYAPDGTEVAHLSERHHPRDDQNAADAAYIAAASPAAVLALLDRIEALEATLHDALPVLQGIALDNARAALGAPAP